MIPNIDRILYASDLSENSKPALAWAMMLADKHDAKIIFLNVTEELSSHAAMAVRSFMGEDKWQEMNQSDQEQSTARIKDRIQEFCQKVESTMDSCPLRVDDIIIKRGFPATLILDESVAQNCDMIVMGTHGAGIFEDAMLGSTARRVVRRSTVPVFVIPLHVQGT